MTQKMKTIIINKIKMITIQNILLSKGNNQKLSKMLKGKK